MPESGSGIEGMRHDCPFARMVADRLATPLRLVDVGCAGGLAEGWRTFGEKLAATAYDPDGDEVARLEAAETNPLVRYLAGYVGLPETHPLRIRLGNRDYHSGWGVGRLAVERSRILRAEREAGQSSDSVERYFGETIRSWLPAEPEGGYDLDYAAVLDVLEPYLGPVHQAADGRPLFYLPAHLAQIRFTEVDFLKIDVDGPDFEILRGSGDMLEQPTLLGVSLEVTFVGSHDANDNSFHNVDRFMRAKGFELFDLSIRPYASAALPSPYMDLHAGITLQGRPFQGDALYLRDLSAPRWGELAARSSNDSLLKLAALCALFGLPDQAAEVLLAHRARLEAAFDVAAGLERLTAQTQESWNGDLSYSEWIERFEAEDPSFFDLYHRRERWLERLISADRTRPELEQRLADSEARARAAERELAALYGSRTWRLTTPLRTLAARLRRQAR